MLYKAKKEFKDLKDKHFHIGTQLILVRGGTINLTEENYKTVPKSVKDCLEKIAPKKNKKKKGDK
tara:strand:+ start:553 stop:747 length:195 start_codon:yes stop_codon:yes gene_type:complete